jgi:UDP-N-acetylmuramate dehydrogenase
MRNPFQGIAGIKVIIGERLAEHTSFHIGGPASYFVQVYSREGLRAVLRKIKANRIRYFTIGAGTNLLVMDRGYRGVVLKLGGIFKSMALYQDECRCGAGLLIKDFIDEVIRAGYSGAEFMAGIPGTLGGAVKGNAGAFGSSISDILERIIIMDENGIERVKTRAEIEFSYRKSDIDNHEIIIGVNLLLNKGRPRTILTMVQRNLSARKRKHPKGYSAGSFFKNPPGHAAGKLIEECGLKGLTIGSAEVSRKHGNYIINRGAARAVDVMTLEREIRKKVRAKTGINLEREVQLLK